MTTATAERPKEAQAAPVAEVKKRKVEPMSPGRVKSGEFIRTHYVATAYPNTNPEDLLEPEYWAHFASQMKVRDRMEVWADDGSWLAEYVVVGVTKNAALVRMLVCHGLEFGLPAGDAPDATKGYELQHRGLHSKWSVIRKSDREVVHDGEDTRQGADLWLTQHLKAFK